MEKITVLIADSTHELKKHLYTAITRLGHECLSALTAEGTLELIHSRKPDMVLCGTQLRDAKGHDLCRQIRNDPGYRGIPVILVTANPVELRDQDGYQDLIDDVLLMPISARELFETIRVHLCPDDEQAGLQVPMKTSVTVRDGSLHRSMTTTCLGNEGLVLEARSPDVVGKVLDMNLTLPGLSIPLVVRGRFLEADGGNLPDSASGMKVKFTEMDDESIAILNIYLQNYVAGAISEANETDRKGASTAVAFIEERLNGA